MLLDALSTYVPDCTLEAREVAGFSDNLTLPAEVKRRSER
jgi:hypothetical protein